MQFERIRKNQKRKIIIGGLILVCITSAITITITRANYKLTQDIPLVRGTINYKVPDLRIVGLYIENDNGDYVESNDVPTDGYTINMEKSMCKVYDGSTSAEDAPKDERITINYHDGVVDFDNISKKNTRCYLYFDKIKDTTKPTISNVTTTVTKTEINVTVSATDNIGVTEYWYQINSNTPIKQTTNTYKFTGLTAGTTYTLKVYVKDAVGNQSDTTTKSAQTTPNGQTSETILAGITVKPGTPTFSNIATTDEGVYSVSDPVYGGYSYYWRGATTNNYVKFANKCWRIVRINGDKTMRLIYDGSSCHANGTSTAESIAKANVSYNLNNNYSYYVGWTYGTSQRTLSGTASNAKTQLESWYNSNLASYASKIADGKYCNDRNVGAGGDSTSWSASGSRFYYAAYTRRESNSPSLACNSGDVYTLKVGLITADEVEFAGGKNADNKSYYLYNGKDYWTMSPYGWLSSSAWVFFVSSNGFLGNDWTSVYTAYGLRPVINLKADTLFAAGGNGTQSNPYVVQ